MRGQSYRKQLQDTKGIIRNVKQRMRDKTITKRKKDKGQTMTNNTQHRKLNRQEQHEPNQQRKKTVVNSRALGW
jgi:hypothetical protein